MSSAESRILIRSAVATAADAPVVCPHDWTIARLKSYLQSSLEYRPEPGKQKLIYAGKCLGDEQTIGEILGGLPTTEAAQVFHLVYTPAVTALKRSAATAEGLRQRTTATPAPVPPTPAPPAAPAHVAQPQVATADSWSAWTAQMSQMYAGSNPHATAYYQAYLNNYAQYMHSVYGMSAVAGGAVHPGLSAGIAAVPPQMGGAVVGAEAGGAAVVEAPAMDAQGGAAAGEDEGRERDWLDLLYLASRAMLLTMILYFYSSIERFILVMVCVVIMYGLNNGWFSLRGAEEAPAAPAAAAAAAAAPTPVQEGNNNPPAEAPTRPDVPLPAEDASPWQLFCSTCYVFVTTFFSSMIPERPPPVNLN